MNLKKNFKKMSVFLTFIILIFSTSITSANFNENIVKKDESDYTKKLHNAEDIANWTVLFYLCCANHLSKEAEKMIENLTIIGSSDDLNLVALKDQNKIRDSRLYYIEKDNLINLNPVYNWSEDVDMSDPNILYSFLNLVIENYPAKHYAMYLSSDWGSGWQGICHDKESPNNGIPLMSIPMFADVFKNITNDGEKKFDLLVLDPCVYGMIEVANEISRYIEYVVFSEEHILDSSDKGPEYIVQYKPCIWSLKNNTDLTSEEFANSFVESYKSTVFPLYVFFSYMNYNKRGRLPIIEKISFILTNFFNSFSNSELQITKLITTLSNIKLEKVEDLSKAVNNLSSDLILYKNDIDINNAIDYARENVREYGKFYSKNFKTWGFYLNFPIEKIAFDSFVDLYDLVELINQSTSNQTVKEACQEVMIKIEEAVIKNSALPDDPSHGLSIYFPKNKYSYNRYLWNNGITNPYETLSFTKDTLWDEFLKNYLEI